MKHDKTTRYNDLPFVTRKIISNLAHESLWKLTLSSWVTVLLCPYFGVEWINSHVDDLVCSVSTQVVKLNQSTSWGYVGSSCMDRLVVLYISCKCAHHLWTFISSIFIDFGYWKGLPTILYQILSFKNHSAVK